MRKSILGDWRFGLIVWFGAELIAFLRSGAIGSLALGIGVVATTLHFVAMWKLIGAASKFMAGPESKGRKLLWSLTIVLALTATLPVLIFAGLYAKTLGGVALTCFLWGLGLVYFGLVGWALSKS